MIKGRLCIIQKLLLSVLFCFLLSIVFLSPITISTPVEQWNKTYSIDNNDSVYAIIQTSDNGYLILGNYYSIYEKFTTNSQQNKNIIETIIDKLISYIYDYLPSSSVVNLNTSIINQSSWILKLDSQGNREWFAPLTKNNPNKIYDIAETSDKGYILAGYISNNENLTANYSSSNDTTTDAWLIKFNDKGYEEWNKTFDVSDNVAFNRVLSIDDGYIVVGNIYYAIENNNTMFKRINWLVKTDRNGSKIWDKSYGIISYSSGIDNLDSLFSIAGTVEGGYILVSENNSFYKWLIKTDNTGNKLWDNSYGKNKKPNDVLSDIDRQYLITKSNEGYVFSGINASQIVLSSSTITDKDINTSIINTTVELKDSAWSLKTDKDGNNKWHHILNTPVKDKLYMILQTADDGYVTLGNNDSMGLFLSKFNSNATKAWTIPLKKYAESTMVKQTYDNGYILLGNGWNNSTRNFRVTKLSNE